MTGDCGREVVGNWCAPSNGLEWRWRRVSEPLPSAGRTGVAKCPAAGLLAADQGHERIYIKGINGPVQVHVGQLAVAVGVRGGVGGRVREGQHERVEVKRVYQSIAVQIAGAAFFAVSSATNGSMSKLLIVPF